MQVKTNDDAGLREAIWNLSGPAYLAKMDALSQAQRAKLDDFLQLERLVIMAKARARRQPIR